MSYPIGKTQGIPDVEHPCATEEKSHDILRQTERPLTFLEDVALSVSVELGTAQIPIRGLLSLKVGSVIVLDSNPNEPLTLKVNGNLLGQGEILSVNGRYGLRINR